MATPKSAGGKPDKADSIGDTLIDDIRRRIGRRVRADALEGDRATYGERIVVSLSRQLEAEYGRGFEEKNLRRMVQFAEAFPDEEIVARAWRRLRWSNFREVLPRKRPLRREFCAEMCQGQRSSVGMLGEKTAALPGRSYDRRIDWQEAHGRRSSALQEEDLQP